MAYDLRERSATVNYEGGINWLPRMRRQQKDSATKDVEIVDRDAMGRVKIHYIGYNSRHDEWKPESELVDLPVQKSSSSTDLLQPFNVYDELSYCIKAALKPSGHRKDPDVRLELPISLLSFNSGLREAGTRVGHDRGHNIYKIQYYNDLCHLLGPCWYLRIIHAHQDFCYVERDSVHFHVHKKNPIVEYDANGREISTHRGCYVLVFKFVRMDGVSPRFRCHKTSCIARVLVTA